MGFLLVQVSFRSQKTNAKLPCFSFFLRLLSPERYLSGHDALALSNERTFGAEAIAPPAVTLMSFERGHDAVVAAASTFGRALISVISANAIAGGVGRSNFRWSGRRRCWRFR